MNQCPLLLTDFIPRLKKNPEGSGSPLCFSCLLLSGSSAAQLFRFVSVPGDQEQEASEKLQQLQAASGLSSQERQEGAATFTDSTGSHTLTAQHLTCPPAAHHPCSNCPFLRDSPGHFLVPGLTLHLCTQLLQILLCHVGKSAVGPKVTLPWKNSHRAP